ncbi:terminase small subunit [Acinetobacter towneri]|uniref:terminase small subunit n=1 Tax=Acinetobacter towneri TaxID=202956 RepID=UPI002935CD70|nr:terminase small subunit [Acinetobacter towneri]MDV2454042.1 terminase small subunit [Acinetobacter towneri]
MTVLQKGRIVNRTGLSEVFGVALNTIDSWVRQGCPVVQKGAGKGQEWQFNTAQVSKWLRDRDVEEATGGIPDDMDELKLRKQKAETELAELELAQKKGEVALISEFERIWAMSMGQLRQNILGVPQRAVLQLLGETDEMAFKEKLRAEIVLALEQTVESEEFFEEEL